MLLNAKKTKKHIVVFAVAAIITIGSIGTAVSALAAENAPKLDTTLSSQRVENLSPKNAIIATEGNKAVALTVGQEDYSAIVNQSDASVASIDDVSKITYKKALPLSAKLSDERHFTQEEWKDILTKIESGEIKLEAE